MLDNSYALTTPAVTGSETLTLTPTSTPALGIAETAGNSSIVPSTTTLTVHLGGAQEWAVATGSVLTEDAPFSGSSDLVFGDVTNSGLVVVPTASPSFGGQITIDSSLVEVESAQAFDDAPVTMTGTSPELTIHNTGTAISFPDSLTISSGNPVVADVGGDTLLGSLTLGTDTVTTLQDLSASASFTISSPVTGSPATLKTQSAGGLVALNGDDTLPDLTPCSVWAASGPTRLTIAAAFPSGCGLQVSLGATFNLNGNSIVTGSVNNAVSGLAGAGTITTTAPRRPP